MRSVVQLTKQNMYEEKLFIDSNSEDMSNDISKKCPETQYVLTNNSDNSDKFDY